jgi:hypothetical protein
VRTFLTRMAAKEMVVAVEAMTGWRLSATNRHSNENGASGRSTATQTLAKRLSPPG